MFHDLGEVLLLLGRTLRALPQTFRQRRKVLEQLFEIGNASLLMACILSVFIGGVLALQTGPELAYRGLRSSFAEVSGGARLHEKLGDADGARRALGESKGQLAVRARPALERIVPWRAKRVGSTQSNISTPRSTAPTRSSGLPTPLR